MSYSPRLSRPSMAHDVVLEPASDAEIDALVWLAYHLGARNVVIGHGRDDISCMNAARFARDWEAGGEAVMVQVSWREEAASWLRQARRLVTPGPDLWVLGGAATGLAQMTRRLAWSTSWEPCRTLVLGTRTMSEALRRAGGGVLEGVRGAHSDGALWQIRDDSMEALHPAEVERSRR